MAKLYHNVYQKSKLLIVFSLIFHYNIKYLERSGNMFFICMLMPASISILIEKRIDKTNKSTSDLILKYLLVNFFHYKFQTKNKVTLLFFTTFLLNMRKCYFFLNVC